MKKVFLFLFFCSPLSVLYLFGQSADNSLVISPSALDCIYDYDQLDPTQVYTLISFFVVFLLILLYSYKYEKSRGLLIAMSVISFVVAMTLVALSLSFLSLVFACMAVIGSLFFLRCAIYRLSIKFDLAVYVISITLAFMVSLIERT
jgi:formate hydrogenlyase subunit 3/multisubunit Na+/H+ antiporter MnhD subunit